jgi:hypothetical protein
LTIEPIRVAEDIPPSQPAVIADTDTNISKEVSLPLENGKLSVTENVIPVNHVKESSHQEQPASIEKVPSNTQEDAPKKSFASIVSLFIYLLIINLFIYLHLCFLSIVQ